MLSAIVFLPALAAAVLLAVPREAPRGVFLWAWTGVSAADLALVIAAWIGYHARGGFGWTENLAWIPGAGVGYRVGVDGLSLPLLALTAVLFLAVALYSLRETRRVKSYVCLFLFLQAVCLGLFTALDLILFFVYFDLSIVGMFFVIAGWGHGPQARAAATKFFLYTFTGSLALLLGFIGLYLAVRPHTFDMVTLIRANPLAGRGVYGGLVLLAVAAGLAIKTPAVPFHTWLPPAHTEAPAAGSAILAGVLLKMGTYGFVRIAMPMLPGTWRRYAVVFVVIGVVSVVYGALVALAQASFKRMIAYTSVNHMGYIILAVGAAGILASGSAQARSLAVTGAVTQMVSHGLLAELPHAATLDSYRGLARRHPGLAAVLVICLLGLVGTPPTSVFVGKLEIFTATIDGGYAWLAALAVANTVASLFYYLRWLAPAFLRGPAGTQPDPLHAAGAWAAASAYAAGTISLALGIAAGAVLPLLTGTLLR